MSFHESKRSGAAEVSPPIDEYVLIASPAIAAMGSVGHKVSNVLSNVANLSFVLSTRGGRQQGGRSAKDRPL